MKKKLMTALGLIFVMFTLVLAGCTGGSSDESTGLADLSTAQGESLSNSGVLILRINPEIAIEYNDKGLVTSVHGKNDDGRKMVEAYTDYIGKESGLVLEELIAMISEAGYFVEEVEGEAKRIVLELESGSVLPEEEFLENMTANVQTAVARLNVDSNVLSNEDMMTLEEAKDIALKNAEVDEANVTFDDKELDKDDGNFIYELEFYADGVEYEYDIHAITGDIVKSERDRDDKDKPAKKEAKTEKKQAKKQDYISMDKAKQIAFDHASVNGSNARFDDQEFDIDDGVPSYELEFDVNGNEYEYDIHAVSGKIIEYNHDLKQPKKQAVKPEPKKKEAKPSEKPASKPAEQKPAPKPASKPVEQKPAPAPKPAPEKPKQLSKDEAINIALNHAGLSRSQVKFDDVELDRDDGRLEWEIEFDSGNWEYEYEIDGHSGKILDFDKEYDD